MKRASSAILIEGASPAPECDHHDEVAQADPNRQQSLSARASLHARAGTEVEREAPKRPALRVRLRNSSWPKKSSDAFANAGAGSGDVENPVDRQQYYRLARDLLAGGT